MKLEHRLGVHRQVELDPADGLVQPKSHFVLDKVYERLQPLGYQRACGGASSSISRFLAVLRKER